MINYAIFKLEWGWIYIAATDTGICNVCLPRKTKNDASSQLQKVKQANWNENTKNPLIQKAHKQITQYFSGARTQFDLPLDFTTGTDFRRKIWQHKKKHSLRPNPLLRLARQQIRQPQSIPRRRRRHGRKPHPPHRPLPPRPRQRPIPHRFRRRPAPQRKNAQTRRLRNKLMGTLKMSTAHVSKRLNSACDKNVKIFPAVGAIPCGCPPLSEKL